MMDDFDRNIFCLEGLPFDAMGYGDAIARIHASIDNQRPCFLSTPNLNFLISCRKDTGFRDSVIQSDLSVVDGMPLVWLARLLTIPIKVRVAGASLFERLRQGPSRAKEHPGNEHLSVYFFGGPDGVAENACNKLNAEAGAVTCAGFQSPGFGSVESLSGDDRIDRINASGADFLVVSLGARKGQAWIQRNRFRILAPVISHLGAVVNFVAGTVSRAPLWMQQVGLEWLWRIREEPTLWKRYAIDAFGLARLLLGRVLPYAVWNLFRNRTDPGPCRSVQVHDEGGDCRIEIQGAQPDVVPEDVRDQFRWLAFRRVAVLVDLSRVGVFGPGFLGQLLMLKKHQNMNGKTLRFTGLSRQAKRLFRWNGAAFLLEPDGVDPLVAGGLQTALS